MGITPRWISSAHTMARSTPRIPERQSADKRSISFSTLEMVVINPDEPDRPTNSPKAVYQIEAGLLELLRTHGTSEWEKILQTWLASIETLKARYAQEREMKRIPIGVAPGKEITLHLGGQNILVEKIVKDFCSIFTAGGRLVYVGDTDEKCFYFDEELLKNLGVAIEAHGKMPDVVVYHEKKNWPR